MNSLRALIAPIYTHEEVIAHLAMAFSLGFSGNTCPDCDHTVNRAVGLAGAPWSCPGCGRFIEGDFDLLPPHDQPDYGPTQLQIRLAESIARMPATVAAMEMKPGMRLVRFSHVVNKRGEVVLEKVKRRERWYAVVPADFPDECVLNVDELGLYWARHANSKNPQPVYPARSGMAAILTFNQLASKRWNDDLAVAALLRAVEESVTANRAVEHQLKGQELRAVGVYQYSGAAGEDSRRVQMKLALAAAAASLKVGILLRRDMDVAKELATMRSLGGQINPDVEIEVIQTKLEGQRAGGTSKRGKVTIVTADALQVIRANPQVWCPDVFELVITVEGYAGNPAWVYDDLKSYLTDALIAIWTDRPPAQEVMIERAITAGPIMMFDAKDFSVRSWPSIPAYSEGIFFMSGPGYHSEWPLMMYAGSPHRAAYGEIATPEPVAIEPENNLNLSDEALSLLFESYHFSGFTGVTCGDCQRTLNVPAGAPHICKCGGLILLDNFGSRQVHDTPDCGPSAARITHAWLTSRRYKEYLLTDGRHSRLVIPGEPIFDEAQLVDRLDLAPEHCDLCHGKPVEEMSLVAIKSNGVPLDNEGKEPICLVIACCKVARLAKSGKQPV